MTYFSYFKKENRALKSIETVRKFFMVTESLSNRHESHFDYHDFNKNYRSSDHKTLMDYAMSCNVESPDLRWDLIKLLLDFKCNPNKTQSNLLGMLHETSVIMKVKKNQESDSQQSKNV